MKIQLRLTFTEAGRRRTWIFPSPTLPENIERAREIAEAFPAA